jgi:flagellar assembly protein FliH
MSAPKPGTLFIQAWGGTDVVAGVAQRPSWIARKALSTRPPNPSIAPLPLPPVIIESTDEPAQPIVSMRAPPMPAFSMRAPPLATAADLAASAAAAQLAEENAALRAQIAEMETAMGRMRIDVLAASEEELVRLAMSIAERVVGRELETDPTLIVAWARECIEQLGAKDGIVVAFAKDVREQIPAVAWADLGVEHRTFADAQLAPGSVEVRTPEGTIAAGAEARLAAVTHALGLEES